MPAVTRTLSIVYGGLTLGGASDNYLLDGEWTVVDGPDSASLSCTLVCRADSVAAFEVVRQALEDELRTPRQRLRVIVGSDTLYDWNPADGVDTGFHQAPNYTFPGDGQVDSDKSVRINVSFQITLDSDKYGNDGRRDSTVTLSYTPSRVRTVTISGEYRAGPSAGPAARAAYEAAISTYATAVTTALGGTWRRIAEPSVSHDDINKTMTFSLTFKEAIYPHSGGTLVDALVDPELVDPQLSITITRSFPGDGPGVSVGRAADLSVNFSTGVDKTLTTDLVGKYERDIKPYLIETAKTEFGAAAAVLTDESFTPDFHENRINVSMRLWLAVGPVLEYEITTTIDEDEGIVLKPIWTGNPFSRYVYQGPKSRIRTTAIRKRVLGVVGADKSSGGKKPGVPGDPASPGTPVGKAAAASTAGSISDDPNTFQEGTVKPPATSKPGTPQWFLMKVSRTFKPTVIGDPSTGTVSVTDINTNTVEEWAVPHGGGKRKRRFGPLTG